jgi:phage/plasmid-associated DNA primase
LLSSQFVVTSNRPPLLDFADAAMEDRLIYFPLERSFVKRENYVEGDPRIRPRDLTLKDQMKTPEAQQELLVWLVKGQVTNSKNGGIGDRPAYLKQCKHELYASNDSLEVFIKSECEVGPSFLIQTSVMHAAYNAYLNQEQKGKCKPSALTKDLKAKGFDKGERIRHHAMMHQFTAYKGLRLKKESVYWDMVQGVFLETDDERRAGRR